MKLSFRFLQRDFDALHAKIDYYDRLLAEAEAGIHESTAHGDVWHDNPAFDEAQQHSRMWRNERDKLREIRDNAEVISPATSGEVVEIGSIVEVQDIRTGAVDRYEIGSYMIIGEKGEKGENENRISYASPMAQLLMGHKLDDVVTGPIGPREVSFKIIGLKAE